MGGWPKEPDLPVLTFHCLPLSLADHFDVVLDRTIWPEPHLYQNRTPNRPRAKFKNWKDALAPKTAIAKSLANLHGIYALSFEYPHPAIYVGFTSGDATIPDDSLTSLKKHRVKVTGSHVGQTHGTGGGIEHTRVWAEYAAPRYRRLRAQGLDADTCEDARFMFATLDTPDPPTAKDLKGFEYSLAQGTAHRALLALFWPKGAIRVTMLNASPTRAVCLDSSICLPDGTTIAV